MMLKKIKPLAALALLGATALAQAAPVTYTMTVDGVTATVNGVGTGAGTTTVIVINADTTAVAAGGPGNCVQGTSGTISNTGINAGAAQALTGNYFVCASATGNNVGVYPSVGGAAVHGGNGGGATGALTGAPAVDLISNLGPVTYIAGSIHSHGGVINLLAGGTYVATAPEFAGTTASTFQVSGIVAAVATSVPTLSEWGVIFLASIMAMFGIAATRRRQN